MSAVMPSSDIQTLLQTLQSKQVKLSVNQGKLGVKAPQGALTAELKAQLKQHKAALITLLESAPSSRAKNAIEAVSREQVLPLSYAQQRLWLLQELEPESHAYNMPACMQLTGPLNITALQTALDALVIRHEILRTTYHGASVAHGSASQNDSSQADSQQTAHSKSQVNSHPKQKIRPAQPVAMTHFEALGETPESDSVKAWLLAQAAVPFNLLHDGALRVQLVKLADDNHVIQWVMHHIAVDAWSIGVIVKEFALLYHTACQQAQNSQGLSAQDLSAQNLNSQSLSAKNLSAQALAEQLPPQPLQYADFAHWQRQQSDNANSKLERDLQYWRDTLGEHQPVLEMPTDFSRPAEQTYNGARIRFALDNVLAKRVQAPPEVTPFVLLLGTFQTLLQEYTGQDDIRVGVPNANRQQLAIQNMVGFFVNTLVMRAQFDDTLSVADFFEQVKQRHLSAQEHQDMPFEMLVDALMVERDMSHSPLFQVMFNYLKADTQGDLRLQDLEIKALDLQPDLAKFDLTLTVESNDEDDSFACILEYNTDLFEPHSIERFIGHYQHLLSEICHALENTPTQPICRLSGLNEADKKQQFESWNQTQLEVDFSQDMVSRFEQQAATAPDAIALTYFEANTFNPQPLTYRELNQYANQLAHYLRDQGLQANERVAVCLHRGAELLISLLAIQKAGGAYLPIDPSYPASRREYILTHANPALVITQPSLTNLVQNVAWLSVSITDKGQWQWETRCGQALSLSLFPCASQSHVTGFKTDNLHLPVSDDQQAYVLYTSGSTGKPKGVQIGRRAFVNFLCAMQEKVQLQNDARFLAVTTVAFDIAGLELFLPLITGAQVVLASQEQARDPWMLHDLIVQNNVTMMQATPATWQMLVEQGKLPAGFHVLCGGEALNAKLANQLLEQGVNLLNVYGPTETTVWSTCYAVTEPLSGVAPIGRPIGNNQCYVLNRFLNPIPVGGVGELYIGGDGLAKGYLKRDDLTQQVFIANPLPGTPGQRLYRTGDKVRYRHDGTLEYLGRTDFQVKIRGFRIELGEIEQHLGALPDVSAVVAHASNDAHGQPRLMASIVPANGQSDLDLQVLRDALLAQVPSYMVPEVFVFLEKLPLTDNGKVNRKALPTFEEAISRAEQNGVDSSTQNVFVAPETDAEIQLCDIWQHILAVPQVGMEDNFFQLGGHSLAATRLIAQINHDFGTTLALKAVFNAQTPAALLALVLDEKEAAEKGVAEKATAIKESTINGKPGHAIADKAIASGSENTLALRPVTEDATPVLSFSQQRLWLLDQIEQGSAHYHLPALLNIEGKLDIARMQRALSAVVARHESLRTVFVEQESGAAAPKVQTASAILLPVIDLSVMKPGKQQVALAQKCESFVAKPFDLSSDVLLRAQLFKVANARYKLLVVMHHIAADGWSMSVLVNDVKAFYSQQSSTLPPLPIQYGDYAHWQQAWMQGDVLASQLGYWREALADLPTVHQLPLDRPRPVVQQFDGAHLQTPISAKQVTAFKALCGANQATLFMGLHALFSTLLARYSQSQDIVMGTPIANREQHEVANLVGFFANTLVLRSDLSQNPSFEALLVQSQHTLLEAYAHQQVPFEKLVDELKPVRSTAHSPLFQVMLSLQNLQQSTLDLPGMTLGFESLPVKTAQFDLTLEVQESADGAASEHALTLNWLYNTHLFDEQTLSQMARHFEELLDAVLANPSQPVFDIALFDEAQLAKLKPHWQAGLSKAPDTCGSAYSYGKHTRPPNKKMPTKINPVEQQLLALWEEVLGQTDIDIHDNFFSLGGNSLAVVKVVSKAKKAGLSMMAHQFYASPTIAELAAMHYQEVARAASAFDTEQNVKQVANHSASSNAAHKALDETELDTFAEETLSISERESIYQHIPGGADNIECIYPLAPLQEGILFIHMMNQHDDPYVLPNRITFPNESALKAFISGVEFVMARHDVLRTAVLWEGLSSPVQVVCKKAKLPVIDISGTQLNDGAQAPALGKSSAKALIQADMQQPQQLDITQAPMLSLTIAKEVSASLQADENTPIYGVLRFHHLISDHEGLRILQDELAAFFAGDAKALPEPVPYRTFVAHALENNEKQDVEGFFKQMLSDVSAPTLPFNLMNVQGVGAQVQTQRAELSPKLAQAVRTVSQAHGVTPASFFHLVWAKVVAACSAKQDVVFGTVLSGRAQSASGPEGLAQTLGVFMNTLPLRVNLAESAQNQASVKGQTQGQAHACAKNDGLTVKQALLNTHQAVSALMPYEQASLALANRCSGLDAETPLFSALLNYRHSGHSAGDKGLFELNEWHERSNYPFSLAVDDVAGEGFGFEVQVDASGLDPEFFETDSIATRVMGYVEQTVAECVAALIEEPFEAVSEEQQKAQPNTVSKKAVLISQINVLSDAERAQLQGWNSTALEIAPSTTLESVFAEQVQQTPNATAVTFNQQILTYAKLDALSDALAVALQNAGVTEESKVVVCQTRSAYTLVSLLAVLKAGGAYVPVDPAYPEDRVRFMLDDANAQWVLSDATVMNSALGQSQFGGQSSAKAAVLAGAKTAAKSAAQPSTQVIDVPAFCDANGVDENSVDLASASASGVNVTKVEAARGESLKHRLNTASPESLAYMIYTSGSTGKPKAVQVTRRNMINFLLGMKTQLQPHACDTLLAVTSLSFDIAVLELFLPLISGANVVIGHETLAQNGPDMMQQIAEHQVTMMQATPVSWKILLASGWQMPSRFSVLCGGEPFPVELAQSLLALIAASPTQSANRNTQPQSVWNLYGPTETTVWSSAYQLQPEQAQNARSVPIGTAIANTQLYVVDEALQPVPAGSIGELCIAGDGVTRGYLGQPELTASRYVDTALGRLYRTGDLARFDTQGVLHCLGRVDHQVKIRGFRIELGEIEVCLAQHEQVQEAVVHAHESHGEPVLVAYLVANTSKVSTQDIAAFLQPMLPNYMIPAQCILLEAMPLTPNGKVDRGALPNPFIEGELAKASQREASAQFEGSTSPENAQIEAQLQAIWQELLGIESIGVQSNFFQLGGHSLLATRLMMRCQEAFEVKLALEDMFQSQTIASMAELIQQTQAAQRDDAPSTLDGDALSRIDDLLAEFE